MADTSPHEGGGPTVRPDIGRAVARHRRGRATLLAMPADVSWRLDDGADADTGMVALRSV